MAVTQKTIAEYVGLSQSVVAEALGGHPRISQTTRQRVSDAAAKFGYTNHSNPAARSMIAQRYGSRPKKDAIAILTPPMGGLVRHVPYYAPILDGIDLEANDLDVDVLLHKLHYGRSPRYIEDFLVDGVISFPVVAERNEWMKQHGVPVVLIDGYQDAMCALRPDHSAGISLCTQHLIDHGHSRIAYFAQKGEYPGSIERKNAFARTMAGNGMTVDPNLSWHECLRMDRPAAAETMTSLLGLYRGFTAIVCHNDMLAMGVIDALHAAGIRTPEDVSVTGFDAISRDYEFEPAITSVAFDRRSMGREAVRTLYTVLDGMIADPSAPPRVIETVMPVTLTIGESTGPVAQRGQLS